MSPRRHRLEGVTEDPSPTVFIFCDEPTHKRRSAVINFRRVAPLDDPDRHNAGNWTPFTMRPTTGGDGVGVTLVNDVPFLDLPEDKRDELIFQRASERTHEVRSGYVLQCRRCNTRNRVVLREETLFSILNRLEAAGVSEVSLPDIRCIVSSNTGQ